MTGLPPTDQIAAIRQPGLDTAGIVGFLDRLFGAFGPAFNACGPPLAFRIGGRRIAVACDVPGYAETVATALSGAMTDPAGAECRIIVTVGSAELPPFPRWSEPYYRERSLEAHLAPTRYRVHHMPDLGFWQVYDRDTGRGIQMMTGPGACPDWDAGAPLRNFLHWQFAAPGRGLVHAGTLGRDGRGLLLAGPGGSGKSGSVLAGVLHGLKTVGDDYVLAGIGDSIDAWPLFTTLKQDPAGYKRLRLDRHLGLAPPLNWQGKHQFTLPALGGAAQADHLRIVALALPHLCGAAQTTVRAATAKEAFLALAPSGVSQVPGDRDASFALAATLARRLPAWHVDLGPDPADVASRLEALIGP